MTMQLTERQAKIDAIQSCVHASEQCHGMGAPSCSAAETADRISRESSADMLSDAVDALRHSPARTGYSLEVAQLLEG